LEVPGNVVLNDVFLDGRVLLVRENLRRELSGIVHGEAKLRDFTWFDWTNVSDISRDGNRLHSMRRESVEEKRFSLFLRKTDGSPPGIAGAGL
jgi:hypothetical protein